MQSSPCKRSQKWAFPRLGWSGVKARWILRAGQEQKQGNWRGYEACEVVDHQSCQPCQATINGWTLLEVEWENTQGLRDDNSNSYCLLSSLKPTRLLFLCYGEKVRVGRIKIEKMLKDTTCSWKRCYGFASIVGDDWDRNTWNKNCHNPDYLWQEVGWLRQ